jgi:hypothetical protein
VIPPIATSNEKREKGKWPSSNPIDRPSMIEALNRNLEMRLGDAATVVIEP